MVEPAGSRDLKRYGKQRTKKRLIKLVIAVKYSDSTNESAAAATKKKKGEQTDV